MVATFLHGTEATEANSGNRTIRTIRTGVIGLVATAPEVAGTGAKATLLIAPLDGSGQIPTPPPGGTLQYYFRATAKEAGVAGNEISITFVDPGGPSIEVVGKDIRVSLELDLNPFGGNGILYEPLKNLIDGHAPAAALVDTEATIPDDSFEDIVKAPGSFSLSGGSSGKYPIGRPILIPGTASQIGDFGTTGTAPGALKTIFKETTPIVILVLVPEGATDEETRANIAGSQADKTGVWALLDGESETGFKPKLLIAPGFSEPTIDDGSGTKVKNPVLANLATVADKLLAFTWGDVPEKDSEFISSAIEDRGFYGDRRLALVTPKVVSFDDDGNKIEEYQSAVWAAVTSRTDLEKGFSKSPSNEFVKGISGLAKPIDFSLGDPQSTANLLNENEVNTIVRVEGFRTWGNRTTSSDPKYAFIPVVRTNDAIMESVQRAHLWAIDQKLSRNYIESVVGGVNDYLKQLRIQEQIVDGKAWFDEALNPLSQLKEGWVHISYDFLPYFPAERLTFVSALNYEYIKEIFP